MLTKGCGACRSHPPLATMRAGTVARGLKKQWHFPNFAKSSNPGNDVNGRSWFIDKPGCYRLFIMFWRLSLASLRVCLKIEYQFVPHLSVAKISHVPFFEKLVIPSVNQKYGNRTAHWSTISPEKTSIWRGCSLATFDPGGFVSWNWAIAK